MAYRVELTRSAETDLEELYLWVVTRAPNQGARWFNGLEKTILTLDRYPERCPLAPESFDPERPVRVLHYGRARSLYRILFWIDSAERIVNVLNVRRGARHTGRPAGPPR